MGGLGDLLEEKGIPHLITQVGSMFSLFFTDQAQLRNFDEVSKCDAERFNRWFHGMLKRGVYLAPSAYEAGFLSMAHTDELIDNTLERAREVIGTL